MDRPLHALDLADLRRRTSSKWRRYPPDVVPAWVAEMDVPVAPAIIDAVTAAVGEGDTGYCWGDDLADAIAAFAAKRWGWRFEASRTRYIPDVMLGSVEVLRLVTEPGDGVVVNPPIYPPFYAFISHARLRPVEAPLGEDLRLDLDALAEVFAHDDVTAYLLCSPHNPTGTVHTADELRAVATLADRHGVRVVADEIHAPLVHDPATRFVPFLSLRESQRGFALLSASKAWNLAGLKAALAVAGHDAVDDLARMPEEVGHGVSHLGVIAHTAAFESAGEWLDGLVADLADSQRQLVGLLAEHVPQVRYRPGPATFLAWLDCRALPLGDDPAAAFLRHGRVALTSGTAFGPGGRGHARLNFATPPAVLAEVVRRMAAAVPDVVADQP